MSTKLKYSFYLDERIDLDDIIQWLEDTVGDDDFLGNELLKALRQAQ